MGIQQNTKDNLAKIEENIKAGMSYTAASKAIGKAGGYYVGACELYGLKKLKTKFTRAQYAAQTRSAAKTEVEPRSVKTIAKKRKSEHLPRVVDIATVEHQSSKLMLFVGSAAELLSLARTL